MIKLLEYLKKYWYLALLAPLFMVLEVAMDMVLSQYMQKMVDYGVQTGNLGNVLRYGAVMVGVLIAGVAGGMLSNVFTNLACYRFGNDLRKSLFQKILHLSLHQADDFRTGSLVTRVTNDVTQVQNAFSMCIRGLVRAASFFVLGIVFTLSISKRFVVVLAVVLPLEVILLLIFVKKIFPVFSVVQKKLDRVNQVVLENVTGARVVKAFSREPYEDKRFGGVNDDYANTLLGVQKTAALLSPVLQLVIFGGSVVIYYIGGRSILSAFAGGSGEMLMVGQISQAITYITMICMSVIMLGMMFTMMAQAWASARRINEILDCPLELTDGTLDPETLTERGTIRFDDVGFTYPDAKQPVLQGLSFSVKQGETVAVVGSTGCGKSTLVNLILRFFDATQGTVYLDGSDVRSYRAADLRKKVAVCLQKAELFAGTIRDNIAFGRLDATDDEVKKAARIAQAEEFILSKAGGYEEPVLEKGASLSGGQRQRISIARAILQRPEILIFDDSTSALDLVTESKLHEAMRAELGDVTKIIVAQRIATAKHADRILVLEGGTISAFDTHDRLMETSAVYRDIYHSQIRKEEA